MTTKIAVVTGANKGIGFQIVRDLCKQFEGDVLLTSRDNSRGHTAVQALEKEGLHPKYHQLDINDHSSIVRLRDFLQSTYGGLDVLVNNAGILYETELFSQLCLGKPREDVPFCEIAKNTCQVNFFANLDVCEVLFPILRPHSRVCNISSGAGKKALNETSQTWRETLLSPKIDMEELKNIMETFVKSAQENSHLEKGFCGFAYGMSKLAMNVMTAIQQREVDKKGGEDILINACSPGFVATDMNCHKGTLTLEEGSETPVYVALLPPNISEPRGKFIRNKEVSKEIQGC
ncbi:hypothetical protein RRG08_037770 [Elysia crispata]|uniref:carbonyl reductase (NADPH) n=1 Tax=Elysia crispata TaxID=231223 RepID=A0AAE1DV79_9GAST|nr:hypothetical protein RRG08_037770 [Elysia crispata]